MTTLRNFILTLRSVLPGRRMMNPNLYGMGELYRPAILRPSWLERHGLRLGAGLMVLTGCGVLLAAAFVAGAL